MNKMDKTLTDKHCAAKKRGVNLQIPQMGEKFQISDDKQKEWWK